MGCVTPPATVLVTGATGYIATHVIKAFLDAGFTVVGTVRRTSSGEYLKGLFPERFSFIIVEDLQTVGALDIEVARVDVIAHTASPVVTPRGQFDPQLLIGPAVEGTRNVLASAALPSSKVRRLVITGTLGSVLEPQKAPYEYSDNDWNDNAVETTRRLGHKAPRQLKYYASKVLAERAVIDFVTQNKPAFDVVRILPTYVFGPIISECASLDALPSSIMVLWKRLTRPDLNPDPETYVDTFVDVRDVARMHVDATMRAELGGTRLLAAHALPVAIQDFYDAYYAIAYSDCQKLPPPYSVPRGRPGAGEVVRGGFSRVARNSQEKFGWDLRGLEETIRDTLRSLYEFSSTK